MLTADASVFIFEYPSTPVANYCKLEMFLGRMGRYRAVPVTINIEFVCPHYNKNRDQKRKPHVVFYNEY